MSSCHHIINPEAIARLKLLDDGGPDGLLKRVIHIYAEITPPKLQEMKDLLKTRPVEVPKLAHFVKSGSANVGADRVVALLQKIEDETFSQGELADALDLLEKEFQMALQELRKITRQQIF